MDFGSDRSLEYEEWCPRHQCMKEEGVVTMGELDCWLCVDEDDAMADAYLKYRGEE